MTIFAHSLNLCKNENCHSQRAKLVTMVGENFQTHSKHHINATTNPPKTTIFASAHLLRINYVTEYSTVVRKISSNELS